MAHRNLVCGHRSDLKPKKLEPVQGFTERQVSRTFVIAADNGDAAVLEATTLASQHGAKSSYLYSSHDAFDDRSIDAFAEAGANLSITLHGAMSDDHATGLNPAGNASLADLAYVAFSFRIVQVRQPAAYGEANISGALDGGRDRD